MVLKIISSLWMICLLLVGCDSQKTDTSPAEFSKQAPKLPKKVYTFSIHPLHNPTLLFEVYEPMIDYINEQLDDAVLQLEASRNYSEYNKRLFSGFFDFSLPNPYQTIQATKHGYRIFAKMADDKEFRGIILVRKDSGIKEIKDLKGKIISYPASTALAATIMPQWYLYKHGIDINKDIKNIYVGSQESSMMSVFLGKSSAGATWPPPWHAFQKRKPEIAKYLKVQWETFSLPNNALVARKDVPKELVDKVRDIITSLHTHPKGKKILQAMELSHYETANDQTYLPVRKFLKKFQKKVRPIRLSHE